MRRLAVLISAGAILSLVFAAGPTQALNPNLVVKVAKEKGGPYRSESRINLDRGDRKTTFWRVESKSLTDLEDLHLFGSDGSNGYKDRWFRGKHDITADATGVDGYSFKLKAGATKFFSAQVKATPDAGLDNCVRGEVDQGTTYEGSALAGVNGRCTAR